MGRVVSSSRIRVQKIQVNERRSPGQEFGCFRDGERPVRIPAARQGCGRL
jgi:hypothetical protein